MTSTPCRPPVDPLLTPVDPVEPKKSIQLSIWGENPPPSPKVGRQGRQGSTEVQQRVNRGITSKYSSLCPLCSKFIAKNRSRVTKLPDSMRLRCTDDRRRSLDDGHFYYWDSRPVWPKEYRWAHADCLPRFYEEPKYEEVDAFEGWSVLMLRRPTERDTYLYRFFDQVGRLLYVGITFDIKQRFGQHAREKPMHLVKRVEWELFETREEARNAERTAIRFEDPVWNVMS